jgi:hypothetical protein
MIPILMAFVVFMALVLLGHQCLLRMVNDDFTVNPKMMSGAIAWWLSAVLFGAVAASRIFGL